jgi:hypothetical protein
MRLALVSKKLAPVGRPTFLKPKTLFWDGIPRSKIGNGSGGMRRNGEFPVRVVVDSEAKKEAEGVCRGHGRYIYLHLEFQ